MKNIPYALATGAAIALSWTANHSIGWAIFHGFIGWLYLGYRLVLHFVH